jgi:fatty-acyl-CoA synthase
MLHGDLLGERARLTPDATALVFVPTGERLTYRELDDRVTRRAQAWLGAMRLRKGDRIGVVAGNSIEFLEAFFAAGKTGVIFVPIGTRLTPHEAATIAADAGLSALFHDAAAAATAAAVSALVPIARVEPLDRLPPPGAPVALGRCDPEDIYMLGYTSGTTGRPKGVMIPHRMVTWNGYNTALGWQLQSDDVSPIFTPLYHVGGLAAFLLPIFAIGGTIVLHAGFDTAEVWRTIESERCTVVLGVPTIWKLLLEAPEFATADLGRVRWFISGGAPLPHYLIDAYQRRGVVFKQGYGMTEVGVNCFAMTVADSQRKAGSVGKPMMFSETRIVDGDGRDLPDGEVGELWIRGPHVSKGYWNNPEATAAALDADGFFHTGDLARRDAEGFHTIAGRQKDMIISGGVNVYPAEIEGQLLLHPDVHDAAVVGIADETWGEVGVAFVVADAAADRDALSAFLGSRLARYKIPRDWVFVDALPRTASGKVVKGELRDRYVARKQDTR